MMGDRHQWHEGPITVIDTANNIKAMVFQNYGKKKGMFGKASAKIDEFEGLIYKPAP